MDKGRDVAGELQRVWMEIASLTQAIRMLFEAQQALNAVVGEIHKACTPLVEEGE